MATCRPRCRARKGVIDCGGFLCVSIQNSMDNVFMVVFSAFKGNMYNKRDKCTCLENGKVQSYLEHHEMIVKAVFFTW